MEVDPPTPDASQNSRTPSGLKSKRRPGQLWGDESRWCLVKSPASFGVGRLCGRCPVVSQHCGPSIPYGAAGTSRTRGTWDFALPGARRACSRYLGLCPHQRETLGLVAWKCLHVTMTLGATPSRAFFCLNRDSHDAVLSR